MNNFKKEPNIFQAPPKGSFDEKIVTQKNPEPFKIGGENSNFSPEEMVQSFFERFLLSPVIIANVKADNWGIVGQDMIAGINKFLDIVKKGGDEEILEKVKSNLLTQFNSLRDIKDKSSFSADSFKKRVREFLENEI